MPFASSPNMFTQSSTKLINKLIYVVADPSCNEMAKGFVMNVYCHLIGPIELLEVYPFIYYLFLSYTCWSSIAQLKVLLQCYVYLFFCLIFGFKSENIWQCDNRMCVFMGQLNWNLEDNKENKERIMNKNMHGMSSYWVVGRDTTFFIIYYVK